MGAHSRRKASNQSSKKNASGWRKNRSASYQAAERRWKQKKKAHNRRKVHTTPAPPVTSLVVPIAGMNYGKLTANESLATAAKHVVIAAIVFQFNGRISSKNVKVRLSPGSVKVHIAIAPPQGVDPLGIAI